MRRRLILVGILATALAACGGSSSSASPSASGSGSSSTSPSADASTSADPAATNQPSVAPSASTAVPGSTATAACDGVTLRKTPSSSGSKVKVITSGTAVHFVATVTGTAYTAGACGNSGNTWLKIDKVGGKSAQSAYGVKYVYAAQGFFQ